MTEKQLVTQIIASLTLAEKLTLLAGANFWETESITNKGLRAVTLNDGPFGLRKPSFLNTGAIGEATIPATSFPTTSLLAATFNAPLLGRMGEALGQECNDQNVDILLGPGINIKRSPLCGRNFEYFSEDPYVTIVLASALVKGIEKTGAGACIKHFAANNQENMRFTTNAIIDPRALNEIYLKPFQTIVEKCNPRAVMCSYNYLNGVKVSESFDLITTKLRKEYKFDGILISDWGAVTDIVNSVKAGVNLEMPGGNLNKENLIAAINNGDLTLEVINEAIKPLISLMVKIKNREYKRSSCDYDANFVLATKIAEDGAVLLKNSERVLPLKPNQKFALIGNFAKNPRFQGLGSSRVTPTKTSSLFNEFQKNGNNFVYADGYHENEILPNEKLIKQACQIAEKADVVIINVGLPEPNEVEGTDRVTLNMPPSHNELIKRVSLVNKNIVIVLNTGSPVVMPWLRRIKALLQMHLPGSAGGLATYNLLFGYANPSGKLTETYPLKTSDTPTAQTYWQSKRNVIYYESIYVGYRYYEKVTQDVLFPFGYGLSYTNFQITNEKYLHNKKTRKFEISFQIKNTGEHTGAEVIQLYVGKKASVTFNPLKELRSFVKVYLKPNEALTVTLYIDEKELMFFDPFSNAWKLEQTTYVFYLGNSSSSTKVIGEHFLSSGEKLQYYEEYKNQVPSYFGDNFLKFISKEENAEFKVLYQNELPFLPTTHLPPYTNEVSLSDVLHVDGIKEIIMQLQNADFSSLNLNVTTKTFFKNNITKLPIRSFVELTNRIFTYEHVAALLFLLNNEKEGAAKIFAEHFKVLLE